MPKPVTVFLRQSLTLKAEVAACLEKPKPRPVHHLRSASRRMEAALELLTSNSGIADLRKVSKPLRRSLRRIRSAAGEVRDLDVHRELLCAYGKSSAAARLDDKLRNLRKRAAAKLQKRLKYDVSRIQHSLDDVEAALKPALDLELSGEDLAGFAQSWFAGAVRSLDVEQDDQLHSIRKAGKTARYLAEVGADASQVAASTSTRFEAAQQTLGDWHDHLLLLEEARASLGDDSDLVRQIEAESLRLRQQATTAAKHLLGSSNAAHVDQPRSVQAKSKQRRAGDPV